MGDFTSTRDKWVCPTDRELSLRAKLKTGWSVKTSDLNTYNKTNQHLNDTEQELIVQVIKRSEALERSEQERIGRLVEKIENMRKNAMGNGLTQCILCADEFGLLGATPQACTDCRKAVCTKCGVDTLGPDKDILWMCKICAETREMWKKSGAWFFKSLPKYTLPPKKQEPSKYSQKSKPTPRVYSGWSQPKAQDSLGKESTESSDDDTIKLSRLRKHHLPKKSLDSTDSTEGILPSLAKATIHSPSPDRSQEEASSPQPSLEYAGAVSSVEHSMPSSQENIDSHFQSFKQTSHYAQNYDEDNYTPVVSQVSNLGTLEFCLLYSAHQQALHCTVYRAKGLRAMDFNGLSDPYIKLHLIPSSYKSNKLRTRTVHKTLNPVFNETVSYFGLLEAELTTKTLRLTVMDEDLMNHEIIGETRILLNKLEPEQVKYFNLYLEQPFPVEGEMIEETDRGSIFISLMYSTSYHALVVNILRCAHLIPRDTNGYADPFIRIMLKPDAMRRRFKTSVKKKSLNPEFNEEFAFEIEPKEMSKRTLEITVWDKDYGKSDDYIGGIQLGIHSKGDRLQHWLDAVHNPDQRVERWHSLSGVTLTDKP